MQAPLTRRLSPLTTEGEESETKRSPEHHKENGRSQSSTQEASTNRTDLVIMHCCIARARARTKQSSTATIDCLVAHMAPLEGRVHGCRRECGSECGEGEVTAGGVSRDGEVEGMEGGVVCAVLELETDDGFGAVCGLADFEG